MTADLNYLQTHGVVVDTLDYRGFMVPFYEDAAGHQLIAIWENKLFEFGVYNTVAKDDLKLLIDEKLDTITRFENDPFWYGAKLEYFDNAGFRDIKLSYKGRLLKVFLGDSAQDSILNEAESLLREEIERRKL